MRDINLMVVGMPQGERQRYINQLFGYLTELVFPIFAKGAREFSQATAAIPSAEFDKMLMKKVAESMEAVIGQTQEMTAAKIKEQRDPKKRNVERDAEIVSLHDEERKSFGQIGPLLAVKNPTWRAKNGTPLARAAVEKAYHRQKNAPDK